MPDPDHKTANRSLFIGYGLVLLGALGFSTKSILIKLAYADSVQLDAISLLALRMLFSLPFFLIVALWQQQKATTTALNRKQISVVIILGLIGYYLASYFDFLGLQTISAGLERVILFSYPTFVVVFTALWHKRWLTARELLAVVLSYLGLLLVFVEHLTLAADNIWLGSALVLASAITFAGFTMGSGVMTQRIGSARYTAYTMSIASFATLTHFAYLHGFALSHFTTRIYGLALLMAIFSTVLPAFFMNAGIRRIGAGSAAIISTTGPIATVILAFFLLGEPISLFQVLGTMFVLAGVFVVSRAKS